MTFVICYFCYITLGYLTLNKFLEAALFPNTLSNILLIAVMFLCWPPIYLGLRILDQDAPF